MTRRPSLRAIAVTTALATLSLILTATPAAARPDSGGATGARPASQGDCPLSRVDRHLVRCDYVTGAGVPAPLSVPEL